MCGLEHNCEWVCEICQCTQNNNGKFFGFSDVSPHFTLVQCIDYIPDGSVKVEMMIV